MQTKEAVAEVSHQSVQQPEVREPVLYAPHSESLRKEVEELDLGNTCAAQGGLCAHLRGLCRNGPDSGVVSKVLWLFTVKLVICGKFEKPQLIDDAKTCRFAQPFPVSPQ